MDTHRWPPPADPAAAARLIERLPGLPRAARPALEALGGNAPYLADLAVREPATLRLALRPEGKGPEGKRPEGKRPEGKRPEGKGGGPDAVLAEVFATLSALSPALPRARLAAALREAKRRAALAIALADLAGAWTLERITGALSELAERTLRLAVAHLFLAAHQAGEVVLPYPADPARGCGFVVLGMGKLGARELNYSSDIDLILLHDPEAGVYHGEAPGAFHTRIARALAGLMEARDADGYVFRVDYRLRPDPGATPPAIALPAALAYYESLGQDWERAAMLKARPVAGDIALGAAFLEAIRPFVWRRYLDFAAIGAIHAIRRRMEAHHGTARVVATDPVARLLGHDVKLGEGGIREIEFLAQTLQLVWGGRDAALRTPRTVSALRLLARAGHLPARVARDLAAAYRFLRAVEHRLQMVADQQTHSLPDTVEGFGRFAVFMNEAAVGEAAGPALAARLLHHMGRVRAGYRDLFERIPGGEEVTERLDFSGVDAAPPATAARLAGFGFAEPQAVVAAVRGWLSGRVRALRSARARELMGEMLPALLAAFGALAQPDAAFMRFEAFLVRLPAGVQILSLFQRNPALIGRIATILGAAPSLADHLTGTPTALEGLIAPGDLPEPGRLLRVRLADARALEDAIEDIRDVVREQDFAIAVATLEGRMDADAAGVARAALVEAVLAALLPRVLDDFAARNGRVRGGAMAVVLLGKGGSREMMAGSDLDLMFLYDHPDSETESRGARRLPASQWFIRAVHAFVAALTAPDAAGPMFAVDMRLRPSGNKGPVAVKLAGFVRYHAEEAWTWERMALTRARVVAGPPAMRAAAAAALAGAMDAAGGVGRIRADAASMRARMARDLPPAGGWDVKLRSGGQIEVEFIAQALQLAHRRAYPQVARPATREALARLGAAGLISAEDAAMLVRADHAWRTVQGMLRVLHGPAPPAAIGPAAAPALLRAAAVPLGEAVVDVAALAATLEDIGQQVRAAFVRLIGEV